MPIVDFSQVEEFPLLPEGEYEAIITKVEEKIAQKTGNEMWALKLSIITPGSDKEAGSSHPSLFDNLVFTPKAFFKIKNLYESLGFDVSKQTECLPADIQGKQIRVTLAIETYEGRTRNKVSGYTKSKLPSGSIISDDEMPF